MFSRPRLTRVRPGSATLEPYQMQSNQTARGFNRLVRLAVVKLRHTARVAVKVWSPETNVWVVR